MTASERQAYQRGRRDDTRAAEQRIERQVTFMQVVNSDLTEAITMQTVWRCPFAWAQILSEMRRTSQENNPTASPKPLLEETAYLSGSRLILLCFKITVLGAKNREKN